jgi:hypothetical protein
MMASTVFTDNGFWLGYVAYDVQQKFKINKAIRQGYANIFFGVRDCLHSRAARNIIGPRD